VAMVTLAFISDVETIHFFCATKPKPVLGKQSETSLDKSITAYCYRLSSLTAVRASSSLQSFNTFGWQKWHLDCNKLTQLFPKIIFWRTQLNIT